MQENLLNGLGFLLQCNSVAGAQYGFVEPTGFERPYALSIAPKAVLLNPAARILERKLMPGICYFSNNADQARETEKRKILRVQNNVRKQIPKRQFLCANAY